MVPLIDTHQHLIYREKAVYDWTKEIPLLAVDNFTIENYKVLTNNLGILGSLFMETGVNDSDYQNEALFVKNITDNIENNILGMITSIRPENDLEFDDWLDKTSDMGVLGYRRILHVMPDDISQNNNFRNNIRKIGKKDKTFDVCFLSTQLKIAFELVKSCDNTKLILNHCGVPNIADNQFDSWRDDIKSLSKLSNLNCKLSGLMAYCAPGTSSLETIRPYVDHILNCFGSNRIVWGSDWPVVNLGKGLPEWISVTRKILENFSDDEAKQIANINAQNIYKIKI